MTTNRDIILELLRTRNVPEVEAQTAADLFCELINDQRCGWGQDRPPKSEGFIKHFGRELMGRMLVMMLDMLSDRLTPDEREKLREKALRTLAV